jgi:hypothetical protein
VGRRSVGAVEVVGFLIFLVPEIPEGEDDDE